MQAHFISPTFGYYIAADGVPIDAVDLAVPPRPSPLHQWAGSAWVSDLAAEAAAAQRAAGVAVQAHLDAQARAMGYDSIHTAVTYADEPAVPSFQRDGQALRAWRSQVWASSYALLADVQAGRRAAPTVPELIAALPAFQPLPEN